eukprot:COSAG06_NODE_12537_length_1367_cov_1.436909_1_plen_71_part_00
MGPAAAARWALGLALLGAELLAPARGDIAGFKAWVTSNGVSTAKIDLAPELGPGLRGMVAATDISVRELE